MTVRGCSYSPRYSARLMFGSSARSSVPPSDPMGQASSSDAALGSPSAHQEAPSPLLLLIRHGETVGNSSGRLQLPSEQLSERGVLQATLLGQALKVAVDRGDFRVTSVIASDYERAQQTLAGILDALDPTQMEIWPEPLLQERNFGHLRGQLYTDVVVEHGDLFAEDFAPLGGESWPEFRARVDLAWTLLVDAAANLKAEPGLPEPALVVVTHGLVLKVLAETYLFPGQTHANFKNTSVTAVRLVNAGGSDGVQVVVEKFNDISHVTDGALDDPLLRSRGGAKL
mmetsp:Transcript_69811/g.227107  ORF Transcript_69811/g.227107 Transcript_69811/m.227107 type:complete len:285 (-) Transcript_69811:90-944(-)